MRTSYTSTQRSGLRDAFEPLPASLASRVLLGSCFPGPSGARCVAVSTLKDAGSGSPTASPRVTAVWTAPLVCEKLVSPVLLLAANHGATLRVDWRLAKERAGRSVAVDSAFSLSLPATSTPFGGSRSRGWAPCLWEPGTSQGEERRHGASAVQWTPAPAVRTEPRSPRK